MVSALIVLAASLAIILGAAWWIRRRLSALPDDAVRPPPPQGFENLTGAEYELIEWELRIEHLPPPGGDEPRGVAPPNE